MQPSFPAELLAEQQQSLLQERFRDDRLSRYGLDTPYRAHVDRRRLHPDPIGMALMKIRPSEAIGAVMTWLARAAASLRGEQAHP